MRNALYLVRPDGHVALADSLARPSELTASLDRWGISTSRANKRAGVA
jgi:hypothetical protein